MQPFENIARDGKSLIVHRGANLSACCLACGERAVGRPITCHLRRDKSGVFHKSPLMNLPLWFYAMEYLLYFFFVFYDFPASRKRKITYGLCRVHKRKRMLMLIGDPLGVVGGILLLGFGIFSSAPMYLGLPATILGLGMLVAAPVLFRLSPGPRLTGQNEQYLWITGVGEKVLAAQPVAARQS